MTSPAEAPFEPERIVAALNQARADYVVVGGLAVAAYGVVRATRDLDIVPDLDPANMARLASALVALGAEHPVQAELTGEALARPVSFKLMTRHGAVQVLNRMHGVPPFGELRAARVQVRIAADAVAPVCSLAHLRSMKRAAGRARDLVDLQELDALERE